MSEAINVGYSARIQGVAGASVDLVVADVEGQFLGLSLTERSGLSMRRVAAEIHDLDQVIALRNSLNAYIERSKKIASAAN